MPKQIAIWNQESIVQLIKTNAKNQQPIIFQGMVNAHQSNAEAQQWGGDAQVYKWSGDDEKVINFWVEDMTIRVHGAMTLGELDCILRDKNQFLPIDGPDAMSVTQAIAEHQYGPLRCEFGSVRDFVLGLSLVDGQGRDIVVGGRAVKNVAGYDVTRLVVGARGQLGIVHQATFKTVARPRASRRIQLRTKDLNTIYTAYNQWICSDAKPSWCWLTREDSDWIVEVGYLGWEAQVDLQAGCLLKSLPEEIRQHQKIQCLTFDQDQQIRKRLCQNRYHATALVKLVVKPNALAGLLEKINQKCLKDPSFNIGALLEFGVAWVGGKMTESQCQRLDQFLKQIFKTSPVGYFVWEKIKFQIGQPLIPKDDGLAKKIKKVFDPHDIFDPAHRLRQGGGDA